MSELTNAQDRQGSFRQNFLANVSVAALLGYAGAVATVDAAPDDADRPTVWVELGGQLESVNGSQAIFAPPFFDHAPPADLAAMSDAQRPPKFSIGGEGKIAFAPQGSDWVFSASVRYGRSNGGNHLHHQTEMAPFTETLFNGADVILYTPTKQTLGDAQTELREAHAIVDFQAGKDFGLGMFGGGTSVISAGVRFAQFTSKADVTLHARPINGFEPVVVPGKYSIREPFRHTYTATAHIDRSVRAWGPSLSWDASTPVIGNGAGSNFTLDWGVNAAILFGRQHVRAHHQITGNYFHVTGGLYYLYNTQLKQTTHYVHPGDSVRSHSVTIPNVGGFAGVSLKFPNAKISVGYRADLFFGAMDGGVDAAKKENRGFYGPFANISIGVGG